jgi:hypothetical protein
MLIDAHMQLNQAKQILNVRLGNLVILVQYKVALKSVD